MPRRTMLCTKFLRRLRRGIKRHQLRNLFAISFVLGCAFVLSMTYLEDCRFLALSSSCEPEYLTVKLNETFVSFYYSATISPSTTLLYRNSTRGKSRIDRGKMKNIEQILKSKISVSTESEIVTGSLELKMDRVFEERRDSSKQACSDMMGEAVEKELALRMSNEIIPKRPPHVSFSVGATSSPSTLGFHMSSITEGQLTNNSSVKRRRKGAFLNLHDLNTTGVGMPRYFQAEMKVFQNRWIHYHRIIQSSKGPTHNKVVEIRWCPIFKAASTPWLAIFTKLTKALTDHTEAAIKKGKMGFLELARTFRLLTPRRYDKNVRPVRTTMVVVRHPFKRLLSGYKDKIERVKGRLYYYNKYSTKILRKYRKHNQSQLERMSKDKDFNLKVPTFQEFVMFVLSFQPKKLDEHWRPMFLDCNPCHWKFDFVLKVETLNEDMKKILKYLHLKETDTQYKELMDVWKRWNNPSTNQTHKNYKNESFYFSQLTKKDVKKLYAVYEPDFRLFGYSPEPYFSMANRNDDEVN